MPESQSPTPRLGVSIARIVGGPCRSSRVEGKRLGKLEIHFRLYRSHHAKRPTRLVCQSHRRSGQTSSPRIATAQWGVGEGRKSRPTPDRYRKPPDVSRSSFDRNLQVALSHPPDGENNETASDSMGRPWRRAWVLSAQPIWSWPHVASTLLTASDRKRLAHTEDFTRQLSVSCNKKRLSRWKGTSARLHFVDAARDSKTDCLPGLMDFDA